VSAVKHGFFLRKFMLCDRCVLNGSCEKFAPGGNCAFEEKAYDTLISELIKQYSLEGLADEIPAQRVTMNLIRIARAEAYEAHVGVSDKSIVLGKYIAKLDGSLRAFLGDLALTPTKRRRRDKGDLLADVERLLERMEKKRKPGKGILGEVLSNMGLVLKDWKAETNAHREVSGEEK